jgi:hypothetical protein
VKRAQQHIRCGTWAFVVVALTAFCTALLVIFNQSETVGAAWGAFLY